MPKGVSGFFVFSVFVCKMILQNLQRVFGGEGGGNVAGLSFQHIDKELRGRGVLVFGCKLKEHAENPLHGIIGKRREIYFELGRRLDGFARGGPQVFGRRFGSRSHDCYVRRIKEGGMFGIVAQKLDFFGRM